MRQGGRRRGPDAGEDVLVCLLFLRAAADAGRQQFGQDPARQQLGRAPDQDFLSGTTATLFEYPELEPRRGLLQMDA
jgi:hypothetical protein